MSGAIIGPSFQKRFSCPEALGKGAVRFRVQHRAPAAVLPGMVRPQFSSRMACRPHRGRKAYGQRGHSEQIEWREGRHSFEIDPISLCPQPTISAYHAGTQPPRPAGKRRTGNLLHLFQQRSSHPDRAAAEFSSTDRHTSVPVPTTPFPKSSTPVQCSRSSFPRSASLVVPRINSVRKRTTRSQEPISTPAGRKSSTANPAFGKYVPLRLSVAFGHRWLQPEYPTTPRRSARSYAVSLLSGFRCGVQSDIASRTVCDVVLSTTSKQLPYIFQRCEPLAQPHQAEPPGCSIAGT